MAIIVAVPKVLREQLTDEGADALVSLINESEEKNKQDIIALSEEKFERRLTEESSKLDKRITEEVAKLDRRITEEAAKLDRRITEEVTKLDRRITEEVAKLEVRIAQSETRILRWLVVLWLTQMAAILGILLKLR